MLLWISGGLRALPTALSRVGNNNMRPLVLMLKLVLRDLMHWAAIVVVLLVAFTSAFSALPPPPHRDASADDGCEALRSTFSNPMSEGPLLLLEIMLNGEAPLHCFGTRGTSSLVLGGLLLLTTILLLNMLIALMNKVRGALLRPRLLRLRPSPTCI